MDNKNCSNEIASGGQTLKSLDSNFRSDGDAVALPWTCRSVIDILPQIVSDLQTGGRNAASRTI